MCIGVRVSGPLELELHIVVSCHVGWRTEPGFFGTADSALNHRAISPAPLGTNFNPHGKGMYSQWAFCSRG